MKISRIPAMLLCGALFCGCGQSDDKKIDQLEKRIAELEGYKMVTQSNVSELYLRNENRKASELDILEFVRTNFLDYAQQQNFKHLMMDIRMDIQETVVSNLITTLNARGGIRVSQSIPSAGTKNGIPIEVYSQIEADAKRMWPSDYDMQIYHINKQVDSYKKLHGSQ